MFIRQPTRDREKTALELETTHFSKTFFFYATSVANYSFRSTGDNNNYPSPAPTT